MEGISKLCALYGTHYYLVEGYVLNSGGATESTNGVITPLMLSGTYVVNPDCVSVTVIDASGLAGQRPST